MKYKVECNFLGGWDDAGWQQTDPKTGFEIPWRFDSIEEAEAEIDDFLIATDAAVARGDMTERYDRDDYRVVEDG